MVQQSPLSFPFGDGVVVIQNNILYHFFGNQMESFCLPIQNLGDLAATFSSDAASIEEKWNFLREIHVVFSQFLEEHTLSYQRNAEKAKADRSLNGIFVGLGGFAQIWNSDHREINVKCFVISLNPEQSPLPFSSKMEPVTGSESTRLLVYNVFRKYTAFGVKPENILNEVAVTAKKKNKSLIKSFHNLIIKEQLK